MQDRTTDQANPCASCFSEGWSIHQTVQGGVLDPGPRPFNVEPSLFFVTHSFGSGPAVDANKSTALEREQIQIYGN